MCVICGLDDAVCCEEESCRNLELEGLWQGEGWRCLHLGVSFEPQGFVLAIFLYVLGFSVAFCN